MTETRQIYDPIADTPPRYRRDPEDAQPPLDYPPYKSTQLRHPKQPLIYLPHTITEITGPALGDARPTASQDADLTAQHDPRAQAGRARDAVLHRPKRGRHRPAV